MDYSQSVETAKRAILSISSQYRDLFDANSIVTTLFDLVYLYEINPAYAQLLKQKGMHIEALNKQLHAIAKSDETQLAVIEDLNESIQRILLLRIGKDKQLQVFNEICESTLRLVRQQSDRFVLLKAMQAAYVDLESRLNGRINTPDQINVLMAQLANLSFDGDEPVRIYDSTSGWGGSLLEMRRVIPNSRKVRLLGQELNAKAYLFCEMVLGLLDDDNTSHALNNSDALVADWPFGDSGADVIINDPPYSMRWNPDPNLLERGIYHKIGVLPPKSRADFAFVLHGLAHLNDNGTMVIQLPQGVLFRGSAEAKIRQYLLERNYIEAVIGLPANLQSTTAIPTMILVLRKNRKRKDVLFIDASDDEVKKARSRDLLSTSAVNKIVETYHKFVSIQRYAYVATPKEIIENDYNLNIPRYVDTYIPPKLISVSELENKIVKIDQQLSTLEADSRLIMMKYQQNSATVNVLVFRSLTFLKKTAEELLMPVKSNELGIEDKLWSAAEKLRGSMDASTYRNVVLGLIFLKYVSDTFEELHAELLASNYPEEAEERDSYDAKNVFWLPSEARWSVIAAAAKTPEVGTTIDKAMTAIERENSSVKGVLPKNYASPDLAKENLGEVIDLFSDVQVGNEESRKNDVLGRVYEFFLRKFATNGDGEFYTPRSIVRTLVDMIEPFKGSIYDPCCGSGGMFVQSEEFVREHQGTILDLSVYGQEWNPTTWRLAKMNLAIHGIDNNLGPRNGNTLLNDLHKGERFDFALANPPFNVKDWGAEKVIDDSRWRWGTPYDGNANYAWIEHILSKLTPDGKAGIVLANGSLSTSTSDEKAIRQALLEDHKVDAIVAMPSQMFYSVSIPVSLWIFDMNQASPNERDRQGETLFIDARELGSMTDRTHREFTRTDINKIADTYHAYTGTSKKVYRDVPGFCKAEKLENIKANEYVLTPGRYVGLAEENQMSEKDFETEMTKLSGELKEQFDKSDQLQNKILKVLRGIGYGE